jgi:hypothetical protein
MGKRGPKAKASDAEIINGLLNGLTTLEVATSLGVSESKVKLVKREHMKPDQNLPSIEVLKAVVRLEITQENTLSELSTQLAEYTTQYKDAADPREKHAWSQNRLKIIDMMAKITGLYERPMESKDKDITVKVEFV